jgi:hypothetical protein
MTPMTRSTNPPTLLPRCSNCGEDLAKTLRLIWHPPKRLIGKKNVSDAGLTAG